MCVRMQWSAMLMFLSVCRVWALPLAAVGRLRVGERQRCCGDPVCVVPPAHGTLWPPADLGRHGAPHLQHIPWLLSMLTFFLFDFLTKYLIVLHFKNRKLGIVIHSCWENGKREDFAILNCMPNKDHQTSASHFDQINAKMQLDFVPCLVALSRVWKLQSHAFYKKYITGPVIKTADITMWFDSCCSVRYTVSNGCFLRQGWWWAVMFGAIWLIAEEGGAFWSSLWQWMAHLGRWPVWPRGSGSFCSCGSSVESGNVMPKEFLHTQRHSEGLDRNHTDRVMTHFTRITWMHLCLTLRVGGSIPVIFSYFSEFQPRLRRGAMISALATFWMAGNILAAGKTIIIIIWAERGVSLKYCLEACTNHFFLFFIFVLILKDEQ